MQSTQSKLSVNWTYRRDPHSKFWFGFTHTLPPLSPLSPLTLLCISPLSNNLLTLKRATCESFQALKRLWKWCEKWTKLLLISSAKFCFVALPIFSVSYAFFSHLSHTHRNTHTSTHILVHTYSHTGAHSSHTFSFKNIIKMLEKQQNTPVRPHNRPCNAHTRLQTHTHAHTHWDSAPYAACYFYTQQKYCKILKMHAKERGSRREGEGERRRCVYR